MKLEKTTIFILIVLIIGAIWIYLNNAGTSDTNSSDIEVSEPVRAEDPIFEAEVETSAETDTSAPPSEPRTSMPSDAGIDATGEMILTPEMEARMAE